LGKVFLLLALAWTGWTLWSNWYKPLPKELVEAEHRDVYVERDSKAISQASTENYYLGDMAPFAAATHVIIPEKFVKQFVPVELDIPPVTVKRPPQLLPEPGPSLEGAEKLPRFGDEFAPPAPNDNAPATPPKNTATPGSTTNPVPAKF